jgi:hypothetical protein
MLPWVFCLIYMILAFSWLLVMHDWFVVVGVSNLGCVGRILVWIEGEFTWTGSHLMDTQITETASAQKIPNRKYD